MRYYITALADNGLRIYLTGEMSVQKIAFDGNSVGRSRIIGINTDVVYFE